ncbi:hypothetical protein KKC1_01200 [Calderihabitans maritimus]|uniref:Uncharacterized protein n=1 Tax=Calderihabitans maritimus TaxID=1246530 RepID=A0A1Z5HND0_9FIRM|nr:hypothetical protein KKC1_01200 [Calderihabitans maritimus]
MAAEIKNPFRNFLIRKCISAKRLPGKFTWKPLFYLLNVFKNAEV